MIRGRRLFLTLIPVILVCASFAARSAAQSSFTVTPSSLTFGNQSTQLASPAQPIFIKNTGKVNIQVASFSISPLLQFQLRNGVAPHTLIPNASEEYDVAFVPSAAQTYNGTITFNVTGFAPVSVSLTGTGFAPGAVIQQTGNALDFGSQIAGTTSAPQTVTITNIGTDAASVVKAQSSSPDYAVASSSHLPHTLNPGASLTLSITFNPAAAQTYYGILRITYDVLADNGASLTGTGTAPTTTTITSLKTLPSATQNSAYMATLVAQGGKAPYRWGLKPGSSLPAQLTLSNNVISGTLASTVAQGTYTFTVQAQDSSRPPQTASKLFSLLVGQPTGANCNQISYDVPGTSTPMTAVTDLGTGTYLGTEGGLYPDGSNVRPADDDAAGVSIADAIQPLDQNGNPDPANGKEVLLIIGESVTQDESLDFVPFSNVDPDRNPYLVIVTGAQGAESMDMLVDLTNNPGYWNNMINLFLPYADVTANQVVAAWIDDTDAYPSGTFPGDMTNLQSQYETVDQILLSLFPNIKLAYYSSRIYSGYSTGVSTVSPEPYAYENAYAVRGMIEDQLNGDPNLNYDPNLGPVLSPWLSWATYYWSNGLLGRSDGLAWSCQDFKFDGTHPSIGTGTLKAADQVINFFKSDDTTRPWFLAAP